MANVRFGIAPPRRKWVMWMLADRISSLSLEQVRCAVLADSAGQPYNPTGDVVKFAFLSSSASPQAGDWKTGGWDTTLIGTYVATCLVGPGGAATLAAGTYYVWVQITDSPEVPVRMVGELVVD